MDRLQERLRTADQTLKTLQDVLSLPFSEIVRDAAIQRFEYSFEAVWKAAKQYLKETEGIETGSPKGVIRACFTSGILDENLAELALQITDERNFSVHLYNETLAQELYHHLPLYADLMQKWVNAIKTRAKIV
jgi:nucleotidyltransferase substrate binding protein (TIGR01987 family)